MHGRWKELNTLMGFIELGLPEGIEFYSADEARVFQMRGQSGGVATAGMVYLATSNNFVYGLQLPMRWIEDPHGYRKEIHEFVNEGVRKFQLCLAENEARRFDPDGGDMGSPDLRPERP